MDYFPEFEVGDIISNKKHGDEGTVSAIKGKFYCVETKTGVLTWWPNFDVELVRRSDDEEEDNEEVESEGN